MIIAVVVRSGIGGVGTCDEKGGPSWSLKTPEQDTSELFWSALFCRDAMSCT